MRSTLFSFLAAACTALAGAAQAEPAPSLVGTWRVAGEAEGAPAHSEAFLTFTADGRFCATERASAASQNAHSGVYTLEDETLTLRMTSPEAQTSDPLIAFSGPNGIELLYVDGHEMRFARMGAAYACVNGAPSGLPAFSSAPAARYDQSLLAR